MEFVRIGICQNWNMSELETIRSEFVRIGICQKPNLSVLEFVRIGICQNWNLSEFGFVRILKRVKQRAEHIFSLKLLMIFHI